VHSLNLAIYLGVVEEFLNVESLPEMPSISTFLDILHPGRPTFSSVDTAESIITSCKALLCSRQGRGKISDDLVRVAMDLPVTNLVVNFDETYGPGTTLVPCIIGRLFQVDGETEEVAPPAYMSYLHHAIDFIDFYLSVRDSRDDKIVLWDRLTGKSHDPEHKLSTEYRFFVPITSENEEKDSSRGLWRLSDCKVSFHLRKMDSDEIHNTAKSTRWSKQEKHRADSDGFLRPMHRLYLEDQWEEGSP
jgi:hypothetical protein